MTDRSRKIPKYRHYKPKNLAVVRIDGKDHYLGSHGSEESFERYHRLVAEWLARPAAGTTATSPVIENPLLTISMLILKYWQFVRAYYLKNDQPTSEQDCIRSALRPLRRLFGNTPVSDFGPRSLKLVREKMIADGLCRTTVNKYIHRVKRMFAWGVEQELLDVRIYQALATVRGLAKGRCDAPEPTPVQPVTPDKIEATLPHLSPVVRAMILFQRHTGCRPGEVCVLRPCDVDTSGPVWRYRPASHKTEHHGRERLIFIGPAAQAILQPFLDRPKDSFFFSPREAKVETAKSTRRAKRKGQPPKRRPGRAPGACYSNDSYRRAITRGCEVAGIEPWAPNQIRHLRATEIRAQFGLEASQTVLGHSTCDVTQLYAERDESLAQRIAAQVG